MPSFCARYASTCHCERVRPEPRAFCSKRRLSDRATSCSRNPSVGAFDSTAGLQLISLLIISLLSYLSSAKSSSSRVWEGDVICRAGYLVLCAEPWMSRRRTAAAFGQREGLGHDRFKNCVPAKFRFDAPNCRLIWLLLPVVDQHLTTGCGQLWTIFLKTSQNGEIALIHQLAAETLDIARAGLLLLLCAAMSKGAGRNRNRQQGECQESFVHCRFLQTSENSINRGDLNQLHGVWNGCVKGFQPFHQSIPMAARSSARHKLIWSSALSSLARHQSRSPLDFLRPPTG